MTDVRPIAGLVAVPVKAIKPNPANVREKLGDVEELADSVREVGILQPLTVERLHDGQFRLLAGHRRLAAAKVAQLTHVPCILRRDQLPDETLALMLIENGQRRNLDPIEEAHALQRLLDMVGSQKEVARRIGKSQATVSQRLSLLLLSKADQNAVRRGDLQVTVAMQKAHAKRDRDPNGSTDRGWHLSQNHPLADDVRTRCDHTNARKVGGQGCGECWEAVIRLDEREQILGTTGKAIPA